MMFVPVSIRALIYDVVASSSEVYAPVTSTRRAEAHPFKGPQRMDAGGADDAPGKVNMRVSLCFHLLIKSISCTRYWTAYTTAYYSDCEDSPRCSSYYTGTAPNDCNRTVHACDKYIDVFDYAMWVFLQRAVAHVSTVHVLLQITVNVMLDGMEKAVT